MKTFDWLTRLKQLVAKNVKRPRDISELHARAWSWPTCACGQLCSRLPRNEVIGCPKDNELRTLGCRFTRQICEQQWRGALNTFRKIERRTSKLLKAALKGLTNE